MAVTVLDAPAKLTLSLRVTGIRPDGYHLLDAEMVTVDLCDTLTIDDDDDDGDGGGDDGAGDDDGSGDRLVIDGPARARPGAGPLSSGEDNLVRRALRLAGRDARVHLHKRIPAGGGLGGGSADAAAVLRWAGFHDLATAATLGADVPFCLLGGRARVSGIGEVVDPLSFELRAFTLLTPPFGVDTAAVYAAWDRLGGPTGPGDNDLEQAALEVEPRLREWRNRLGEATGREPTLAGSGSTWFVEGEHPGDDLTVVHTLRRIA